MASTENNNSGETKSNMMEVKLSTGISFGLVHVGKCGGGSVAHELRSRNYTFDHYHMRRPVYRDDYSYVVLVRDPISRFVSAFNWRYYLLTEGRLCSTSDPNPMVQLRHRFEREFLSQFENVNAFAEQLTRRNIFDVTPGSILMMLVGHVMHGFHWYLDELLNRMRPGQLAGIITMENLAADVEALFGFRLVQETHRHYPKRSIALSEEGRANLLRELETEYTTLSRLKILADQAGVRMSMSYDPVNGAAPRPL